MTKALRYAGQVAIYAAIALVIGYFANAPSYSSAPAGSAQIKLGLAYSAKSKGGCRDLTSEELEKLPPNMRRTRICSRERLPIVVELRSNEEILYAAMLEPSGVAGDGPSQTFQRFVVEPGRHELVASMRDTARAEGFDYVSEHTVDLRPGQSLAIDFSSTNHRFIFE